MHQKGKKYKNNLSSALEILRKKSKLSLKPDLKGNNKIRAELNKTEKKKNREIQESKIFFQLNINKTDKSL